MNTFHPPAVLTQDSTNSQTDKASTRLPDRGIDSERPTMLKEPRTRIWDVPFDRVTITEATRRIGELVTQRDPSYVITANLNYVMLHQASDEVKRVTREASMILADGQPIVWRSILDDRRLPERVAGSEMIYDLADQASRNGWRIYMLGGAPGVAEKASDRLCQLYPDLQVSGIESPPFRELTDQEQQVQIERIRESRSDLLLVAFGQPKGELWIHRHYRQLGVPVCIQLGASFDFLAGTADRAPLAWQRLGLEWAYRMLGDPSRLVPRYIANARFLLSELSREVTSYLVSNRLRMVGRENHSG